jgi:hypothetical protein
MRSMIVDEPGIGPGDEGRPGPSSGWFGTRRKGTSITLDMGGGFTSARADGTVFSRPDPSGPRNGADPALTIGFPSPNIFSSRMSILLLFSRAFGAAIALTLPYRLPSGQRPAKREAMAALVCLSILAALAIATIPLAVLVVSSTHRQLAERFISHLEESSVTGGEPTKAVLAKIDIAKVQAETSLETKRAGIRWQEQRLRELNQSGGSVEDFIEGN